MTIVLIAIALYLSATGLLVSAVRRDGGRGARGWLLPANFAVLLHGLAHLLAWRVAGGADLHFFAALSLVGLGMPVLTILLSDLEPHEIAAGSGLATFVRTLGGSFAASLTTWAWNQRSTIHHAQLTEHIGAYDPQIQQTVDQLGRGDPTRGALALNQMISQQAAQIGFNEMLYLIGILFVVVTAFVWMAKPPFSAKVGGGAAAAGGH